MAKSYIRLSSRVLIEKITPPSKTTGGILLPEIKFPETVINSISVLFVAVGPGHYDKEGKLIPVCVKEGGTILLPEYRGKEVKLVDKEYLLLQGDDILTLHD